MVTVTDEFVSRTIEGPGEISIETCLGHVISAELIHMRDERSVIIHMSEDHWPPCDVELTEEQARFFARGILHVLGETP